MPMKLEMKLKKVEKLLRLSRDYLDARFLNGRYPFYLDVRLTTDCNNRCSYCCIPRGKHEFIDTETFKQVLDILADHVFMIVLSGGEPLMHPGIDEIIRHIHDRGPIYSILVTNGRLVPEKIESLKMLKRVLVSLDGTKEHHDDLRGEGSWEAAVKAIRLLRSNGIRVTTNTVITSKNADQVDYVLELAEREDANCMFQPVTPATTPEENVERLMPDAEQIARLQKKITNQPRVKMFKRTIDNFSNYPENDCNRLFSKRMSFFLNTDGRVHGCFGTCDMSEGVRLTTIEDLHRVRLIQSRNCWCNDKFELEHLLNIPWIA